MDEKLRNMTSLYITKGNQMLLLFRQHGSVVSDTWVGSAGGHFEENERNNPKACVLRELKEELGISEHAIRNLVLRYVTLRRMKGEIRQNYYFSRNWRRMGNELILRYCRNTNKNWCNTEHILDTVSK